MAKFKVDLSIKKLEKDLNKTITKVIQEEQKKLDIQKSIKGDSEMVLLNEIEEEMLDIILNQLKGNDNSVATRYDVFPNYIYRQIKDILYKLKISGYIASWDCWLNVLNIIVTPLGMKYFEKKGMRKELFEELPDNAKKLLQKLLECENNNEEIDEVLRNELEKDTTDRITRGVIGTLKSNGLLIVQWADDTVYYAELTNAGRTYFEREKKYMEQIEKTNKPSISIENLTNSGFLNMGSIVDSNITINNSIKEIQKDIENNAKEDKEELYEILEEVEDYIDNMKNNKVITKNTGLFKRIGNHFEKHQWFYSKVIGVLGQAILLGMGNQI